MKILTVEQIAVVVHSATRTYDVLCENEAHKLAFHECSKWYQKSLIRNCQQILDGSPSLSPERAHENWMTEQLVDGWKYGEVLDVEEKNSPYMLPYRSLPDVAKAKVLLVLAMVKAARKFVKEEEVTANEAGEGI